MGCLCSAGGNFHDATWAFAADRARFQAAARRATSGPPKWTLKGESTADGVDTFLCDRRTDRHGFIDNITLTVTYSGGTAHVVAHSNCSNPNHTYDWGQNKRNLTQLKARLDKELTPGTQH